MENKKLIAAILASSLCLNQCLGSVAIASSKYSVSSDTEIYDVTDNYGVSDDTIILDPSVLDPTILETEVIDPYAILADTFVKPVNFTDAGPLIDPVTVPIVEVEDDEFSMYADQDSSSLISPMAMSMSGFGISTTSADYGISAIENYDILAIEDEPESDTDDGVILNKSVSEPTTEEDDYYTISLESYTTGSVSYVTEGTPTDIILVLDQSASMYEDFYGDNSIEDTDYIFGQSFIDTDIGETYYVPSEQGDGDWEDTRQYALINAVRDFIDSVNEDAATYSAEDGDFYHRISVVAYSSAYGESAASDGDEQDSALGLFLDDNVNTYRTLYDYPEGLDDDNDKYDEEYYDYPETNTGTSVQSVENAFVILDGSDTDGLGIEEDGNLTKNGAEINQLKKWVQQLDADRGTPTDDGMDEARQIMGMLEAEETTEERNRVVVLFTDGAPKDTTEANFEIVYADRAIDDAYVMKNTYGASVYGVGIFDGANPDVITGGASTEVGTTWTVEANSYDYLVYNASANNRFMNFISSKSDDADDLGLEETTNSGVPTGYRITDEYNWDEKAAYYLTAGDSDSLSDIFTSISDQITVSNVTLTETTQVRDYVSDYFQLPEEYTVDEIFENLSLEVLACTGENIYAPVGEEIYLWADSGIEFTYDSDGDSYTDNGDGTYTATFTPKTSWDDSYELTVTYDEEQKGILVNGFNYNDNFVTVDTKADGKYTNGGAHGSKLVIEFDIERAEGFIGGNDVASNTSQSGIYVAGSEGAVEGSYVYSSLEFFEVPVTDVEIEYDVSTRDQTIFLGNIMALDKILQIDDHDIFGFSNFYVDITFYVLAEGTIEDTANFTDDEFDIATVTDYEIDGTTPIYNNTFIAELYIPAQTSATDAMTLFNDALPEVMPDQSTEYDVFCLVTPSTNSTTSDTGGVADLETYELATTVRVLHPQVNGEDIWVDFGATVNLRQDGTSPITWGAIADDEYIDSINLFEANASYPPTVYYIYQNKVTGEYFKSQYQVDWNNDGDLEDDGEIGTAIGGTISYETSTLDGFTLKTATGENNVNVRENIDVNVVGDREYEIVAMQILSSDGYQNVSYVSAESDVYTSMEDDDITNDNAFNVFVNEYEVSITKTVDYDEYLAYPQSFVFTAQQTGYDYVEDLSDDSYDDTDIETDAEGRQIVYREPNIIDVVMLPTDFTDNGDGTMSCTVTIVNLIAGLETTVTEDTDWSWRYTLDNSATEVWAVSADDDTTKIPASSDDTTTDEDYFDAYYINGGELDANNTEHAITGEVNEDGSITVKYYHALYESDVDTNKNGFIDTIVDIDGDGIPDTDAFVYRDRNNDTYVDIDILRPTADELADGTFEYNEYSGDYDYYDIPFDLDNDEFVDMLVSAATAGTDGFRLITDSMTAYTTDYFTGFYLNEDGNIYGNQKLTLIFNRQTKYFNGYYVDYFSYDPDNAANVTAVVSGGNGGIYAVDDTEMISDLSGSSEYEFEITKAEDEDGNNVGHNNGNAFSTLLITAYAVDDDGNRLTGVSEETIECYGTGRVILATPTNLVSFDRDGDGVDYVEVGDTTGRVDTVEGADNQLPLRVRDTYRYINVDESLVFTEGITNATTIASGGGAPADGLIFVGFTNDLSVENWLSKQYAIVNEFDEIGGDEGEVE
ncbi:MAG: hypothetical protein R3Y09_11435 [Clostridia bacterium]